MNTIKQHPLLVAFLLIVLAVVSRLLPHPPNVAPIAAVGLFSGVYVRNKFSFIVPIVSMLISDVFIGFYGPVMIAVYGSFALSVLIGRFLQNSPSRLKIIIGALLSSSIFFFITNLAVWYFGTMYTKDVSGLMTCFVAAVPFFRNTLLGDLFYTSTLFQLYSVLVGEQQRATRRIGNIASV